MSDMSWPECEGNKVDLKMGLKEDYCAIRLPAGVFIYLQQITDAKSKDVR